MIEVLKQAMEALKRIEHPDQSDVIDVLRQSIAELESQDSLAWDVWVEETQKMTIALRHGVKFLLMSEENAVRIGNAIRNTHPLQRTWVGLTNDEIVDVIHPLVMADMPDVATDYEIAKAIEAKLKELNT